MSRSTPIVVVAFNLLKRAEQKFFGIVCVTGEPVLIGSHDPLRRFAQTFTARIIACPAQQRVHGRFGFGARRARGPQPGARDRLYGYCGFGHERFPR
jgi:hypothetical protein